MSIDWQQQVQQIVEQGKKSAVGMVGAGEMLIDADPSSGFLRVKLRNVQPPEIIPQLVSGFCYVLATGGTMFNLQVKQHIRESEESKNE